MSEWKKIPGVSDWEYWIDQAGHLWIRRNSDFVSVDEEDIFSLKSEAPAAAKFFADYAAGKLPEQKSKVRTP